MIRLAGSSESAAHWSEEHYRSLILADNAPNVTVALVAESSEMSTIVGFLIARRLALEWELENLVVAPNMQGRGLGIRLLQRLVAHVQQINSTSVFLEVRESNAAARALYRKAGFREIGRRKSYYSNPLEDAILYCKVLSDAVSD